MYAPRILVAKEKWEDTPLEMDVQKAVDRALQEYARTIAAAPGNAEVERRAGEALQAAWADIMFRVLAGAANDAANGVGLETTFTLSNPFVQEFMATQGAELVTSINEQMRETIRDEMVRNVVAKAPPREAARELAKFIPLLPAHARFVARVQEADGVEKAAREAKRLLRYRAQMIARTETIIAQNAGTDVAWSEAKAAGLIQREVQRAWLASPAGRRTCDICRALHQVRASLDGSFTAEGKTFRRPPAHPMCRCTMGLVLAKSIVAWQVRRVRMDEPTAFLLAA